MPSAFMRKLESRGRAGRFCPKLTLVTIALTFGHSRAIAEYPPSPADSTDGQKLFRQNCAGCHGADARGNDKAPALSGNRRVSDRSIQQLRQLIKTGIPGTGMPAFDLPSKDLDALAEFLHSMNGQAAGTSQQGDAAAGEAYFFGKGKCSSCLMVASQGSPIGPDLSNLGNEMTTAEIETAVKNPSAHITPGSENKTSPMTYMVGGKQFVAIAIGPNILCFGLPADCEKK